jgi:hypothetical protein
MNADSDDETQQFFHIFMNSNWAAIDLRNVKHNFPDFSSVNKRNVKHNFPDFSSVNGKELPFYGWNIF